MMRIRRIIFLLLPFCSIQAEIRQLHVLTRHGARDHLRKTAVTLGESGGILTKAGELQMEELGIWLKNAYGDGSLPQLQMVSSPTQRTIVSAMGLSRGYTNATNIPVYSTKEVNDVDIRGYNKCLTFQNYLKNLYESETWKSLEQSEANLLERLAQSKRYGSHAENGRISLENAWNIFDDIAVCQSMGKSQSQCTSDGATAPLLTDEEWIRLQNIVHQAELLKYHSPAAGDLVGTNLLRRIAQDDRSGLFMVYSGHYPTILPVLTKLKIDDYDPNVIPPFASALLFEDHVNGPFRVLFKPGDSNQATVMKEWNTRQDFMQDIMGGFDSHYDWCTLCDNTSADICLSPTKDSSSSPSVNSTAASFVLGSGLGALLVLAGWTFRHKCCRRSKAPPPRQAVMHSNGDFS